MNKQDIIKAMAEAADISQATAQKALEAFLESLTTSLRKGDPLRLVGYFTLDKKAVPEKTVRNPRDGSPVKVPAGFRIKFAAGKELKDAANKN